MPEQSIPANEPSRRKDWLVWTGLAVAPWFWFAVRDLTAWADLLAIGLPVLAALWIALLGIVGFARRQPRSMLAIVSGLLVAVVAIVGPTSPQDRPDPSESFSFAAANLSLYWFSDNDFDWQLELDPVQVLVTSEMQLSHRTILRERYANFVDDVIPEQRNRVPPRPGDRSFSRFGFPSIGVYSDFEMTELPDTSGIEGGLPGIRVRLELPTGPVILYALHVPKPAFGNGDYQTSYRGHGEVVQKIADMIKAEELPTIVMGDLNTTDRGRAYRSLIDAGLLDVARVGWTKPTSVSPPWWRKFLMLRIDHILASPSLCTASAEFRDVPFSDHRMVYAEVGPCS